MSDIIICEDSVWDVFNRYHVVLESNHTAHIFCDGVIHDPLQQRLIKNPPQCDYTLYVGIPSALLIAQIGPALVCTDGLGGKCWDVVAAATTARYAEKTYLFTDTPRLRDGAKGKCKIIHDHSDIARLLNDI